MQLPDLKELDKLIALCRKRGVTVVKVGELQLTLSEDAPASKPRGKAAAKKAAEAPGEPENFDSLSEEDKLFWSTGGIEVNPEGGNQ